MNRRENKALGENKWISPFVKICPQATIHQDLLLLFIQNDPDDPVLTENTNMTLQNLHARETERT